MGFNPYNGVSRGVGGTRTPIAVYEKVLVGLELSQWCFEGCWRGLEPNSDVSRVVGGG